MKLRIGEWLKKYVAKEVGPSDGTSMTFPPPIAKTLGFDLVAVGDGTVTMEMITRPEVHANPMGTIHGGVLCDIADFAIGTAHATTLAEGESFTSVDLKINFFKPIWTEKIRAVAKPVKTGKTLSFYHCDILKEDGSLVATVSSTVMTLRGEQSKGR
jgi:uncharacterized protein (TIGR00369 family)